jgi:hypothetical protein
MSGVTQADCDYIALKLNARPRKRHGFHTPQKVYDAALQELRFKIELPTTSAPLASASSLSISLPLHAPER